MQCQTDDCSNEGLWVVQHDTGKSYPLCRSHALTVKEGWDFRHMGVKLRKATEADTNYKWPTVQAS